MRGITAGVISVFVLGLFISPGVGAESSEQIEAKITMMDGDAKPATTPGPGSVDQGKVAFDFNHRSIFIALEEPTAVSSIVLKSDSGIFADASNVNLTADRLEVYFSNDNVEFEKVSFGYHTPDNSTIVLDGLQGVAKYLKIHTTCGWTTPYRFVNQLGKMVSITAGIMATTQAITADSSAEQSQVSARKKTFENVKILNNLVWELLNVDKHQQGTFSKEYRFSAPETCWIFIQSTATSGSGGEVRVFVEGLNSEAPLLTHGPGKPDVQEAMRQVSAGQHTLRIEGKGDAELSHLTVRRIPTLRYGMFDPYPRMVNEFGPYDRKFLAEDVLRNVNTILDAHWDNNDFEFLKEWKAQGRKFFMHDAVKYFEKGAPDAVEQCVRYWTNKQEGNTCCGVGMLHPLFDGICIDEFTQHQEPFLYDGWRAALDRLNTDPAFKNRTVDGYYGWNDDELPAEYAHKSMQECLNALMAHGGMVYLERYLTEARTEEEAQKEIRNRLVGGIVSWLKYFPDSIGQIAACLGVECIPDEMFNLDPGVDFKVFLDMQFQALATDPALFGLGGIDTWGLHRADEETVRWMGRLYRHYAIEGNTRRMCDDPYVLAHIENPDFEDGVKGWRLEPAEEGSMAPRKLVPYRAIQGRYGGDVGDTFLWTKRNAAKPNRFSQTVRNLQPGRCYSMKMITADYGNISRGISESKEDTVNIQLTDVEFLPGPRRNFHVNYAQTSNYADATWSSSKPPCFTYHWLVFRAKRDSAELTISDWVSDTAPGGPIGQEFMFNFIEIQPYLED